MTPIVPAPPAAPASPSRRAPRAVGFEAALVAAALALCLGVGAPPARAAPAPEDTAPVPPKIFFPDPDEETAQEIEKIIENYFGDQSKVLTGRDLLVNRWHVWSVPALVRRVEAAANESETWNSALTLGSICARWGPAREAWTAIGPLVHLLKSPEPYRRTFAALALGEFYGPDSVGPPPARRAEPPNDPAAKARAALAEAVQGLVAALSDANIPVRTAAALALGKTGGMTTWHLTIDKIRGISSEASPEPQMALLLALGLLAPGSDENRPAQALTDIERRVRAAAALSIALRYVSLAVGGATRDAQTASRAAALDKSLSNSAIRLNEWDGAEATYARGVLALVATDPARSPVWAELYALAISPTTERRTATAAAQALLFCPADAVDESGRHIRDLIADFSGRDNAGHALKEPVLAAFLVMAGSDGTPIGVHACARYLKHVDRDPRGKLEYDVRYHAAVGLVRALEAGRIASPEAKGEAVDALLEAARIVLPRPTAGRSFRSVLGDIIEPQKTALLANPGARLLAGDAARLEAIFEDPDALLAHDPIDVVLDRLNDATRDVFGLDNLFKASGPLNPSSAKEKEATPLRFLLGWVTQNAYFTRLDLHPLRGRPPAPPPPPLDDPRELDR